MVITTTHQEKHHSSIHAVTCDARTHPSISLSLGDSLYRNPIVNTRLNRGGNAMVHCLQVVVKKLPLLSSKA